jgi:type IV pilus assembly protein PilY1
MKLQKTLIGLSVGLACLGGQQAALGDDIDVFVGGTSSSSIPNLVIILDNSSNWSGSLAPDTSLGTSKKQTKFYHEMKALGLILDKLGDCKKEADGTTCKSPTVSIGEGLRIGLMMFSETGTNGGYVRYDLRVMNDANRNALKCMLTGTPIKDKSGFTCNATISPGLVESGTDTDNSASNSPYAKTMFEAFKYFGGYTSPAYAFKDQQPPSAVNNATNFGPIAYAGWEAEPKSGKATGPMRRDYPSNSKPRSAYKAFTATGGTYNEGAFINIDDYDYEDPVSDGCAKNFIIFVSNGNPGTGGDSGGTKEGDLLANVGGNTTQITDLSGSTVHASYADEFARFLNQTDVSKLAGQQNVVTYTMAVYDPADADQTSTKEQIKLMNSMATAGGGNYYEATNGDLVVDGLLSAINQILARDSTFVTASLPVNTNAQGEFLDQVFIGMFRPDANGNPRWWGNVKQYRLACMIGTTEDTTCGPTSSVKLVDSSTPPKVIYSAGTAFIDSAVNSYWTSSSTFWKNDPRGTSSTPTSDSPDGEVVEKGGVAQRLRIKYSTDQSARNVLTCASTGTAAVGNVASNCGIKNSSLIKFTATGTTPTLSQSSDSDKFFQAATPIPSELDLASKTTWGALSSSANQTTEFNRLINWVRGTDNINPSDERGPGGGVTVRPSIHGDVVHSRPVALDFGGTTGVVLFYGDNHGHLHAVKGDAATSNNGGEELWSFIAPEFFPKLARLRANQPALLTPVTPGGIDPAPLRKDYFWDGAITAYQDKKNNEAYLFVTARRGGRFIYALNISDPTDPKFLWKIDPATTGFSKLGQTWSTPVVTRIKGNTNPVLIFGGGYPGDYKNGTTPICEDAEGSSRDHTDSTSGCDRGYGVYIVDAFDGTLIKHIAGTGTKTVRTTSGTTTVVTTTTPSMDYAIPSDVYPMDSDFDGYTDRLYVGDLGGRLWRIEISDTVADKANWAAYLLAEFGNENKIFYRPAVVQQNSYTAVLVGTGDREKPLVTTNLDGFYMVKDTLTDFLTSANAGSWNSVDASQLCTQSYNAGTSTWACDSSAEQYGWKYSLQAGEKVVNSPRVAFSIVNFATNVPQANTAGQCQNTGEARSYQTNFVDGTSAFSSGALYAVMGTGGLAPTAFVGIVDINGHKVPVIIGGGVGDSGCVGPTCANSKPLTINSPRTKRYWYKKKD